MPYDPLTGQWRDDATGVPDAGMPPGMGDPTGGIVPAPQQTPMAPQQIAPRPMAGTAFTPSAMDVAGNPLQAPPIPPPITDPQVGQQIQQGFQQLDRPSMSPGNLAATILKAPLTVPMGIVEELRGLLGGDTIEGWAQEARGRYNDPNFTESRAFGVQGPAAEPSFGDRFTGVVTGSAQRGAMAGKIIRQQIGAYNANRRAALKETKDVQQLQLGDINLQKGTFDVQTQEEEFKSRMRARQSATRASGLAGDRSAFLLNRDQQREAKLRSLAEAIQQNPDLARDPRALMLAAGGDLDLANKAITATTAIGNMPAPDTGLPRGEEYKFDIGREAREAAARATQEERDRQEAARKADDMARDLGVTQKAVEAAFKARHEAVRDPTLPSWLGGGPSGDDQLEKLRIEQAQLQADIAAGKITMPEAILRASGLPTNTPMPAASPVPGATPTPSALVDRIGTMSPADKAAEILQRDAEAAVPTPGIRPTPMATPKPLGTTHFVDLNKAPPEATRQADATKEARLNEEFLLNWVQHEGWNTPRSGARFENKKAAFMARNGL